MSYCRIGEDSDVYVIRTGDFFQITLTGGAIWSLGTSQEALDLLRIVQKAGYTVPDRAMTRLQAQINCSVIESGHAQ